MWKDKSETRVIGLPSVSVVIAMRVTIGAPSQMTASAPNDALLIRSRARARASSSVGRIGLLAMTSGSARDAVDFDQSADGQRGDTDCGARRASVGGEVALVTFVKGGVVAVEFGEEASTLNDVAEVHVQFCEDQCEVFHHACGLCCDAVGQGRVRGVRVGGHLPCEDDPTIGFNGVAEGCDGAGPVCEKVEFGGHGGVLGGGWCQSIARRTSLCRRGLSGDGGDEAGAEALDFRRGVIEWERERDVSEKCRCGFVEFKAVQDVAKALVAHGEGLPVEGLAVGRDSERAGAVKPHAEDRGVGPRNRGSDGDCVGLGLARVVGEGQVSVRCFMGDGADRRGRELPRGGRGGEHGEGDEYTHDGDIVRHLRASAFHFGNVEIYVDMVAVGIEEIDLNNGETGHRIKTVGDAVGVKKGAELGEAFRTEGKVFEGQI